MSRESNDNKRPVAELRAKFNENADYSLALSLQDKEYTDHYDANRNSRRVSGRDHRLSREQQSIEDQNAMAAHRAQMDEISSADFELAQKLQEEFEAESRRVREEQLKSDMEIARMFKEKVVLQVVGNSLHNMPRDKPKEKDASSRRKKRNKSKPRVKDSSTTREKSKKTTIRRLVRSKDNAKKKTNEDQVPTSPAIITTPVSSTPISTTPPTEKNKDDHSTKEVAKKQSDSMMGTVFVPVENQHPAVSPASSSSKSRSKKKKKKKAATVETAETLTKEEAEAAVVQPPPDSSKEQTVQKETNPDTPPAAIVVPEMKSARELEEFVVKSSKRKKKSSDSHKTKRSVEESPRERPSKAVDEDQAATGDQHQNRDETRRKVSTQTAADTPPADSPQPTPGNDILPFSVYAYKNRNNDRENA
ncbi:hypothetical protein M3Y95_00572500 [Aphelenchoides besseyi]|nr:hypothetical protein M3Y95_00572500 [Aphelenchoides besseyi]